MRPGDEIQAGVVASWGRRRPVEGGLRCLYAGIREGVVLFDEDTVSAYNLTQLGG